MQTRPDETSAGHDPSRDEQAGVRGVEIDSLTRRLPTERLEQGGIKSIRILSETRFRAVLEEIVEERVRRRLAATTPADALAAIREDYRDRWALFRSRYEEKLRRLEEALTACSAGSPPPPMR